MIEMATITKLEKILQRTVVSVAYYIAFICDFIFITHTVDWQHLDRGGIKSRCHNSLFLMERCTPNRQHRSCQALGIRFPFKMRYSDVRHTKNN